LARREHLLQMTVWSLMPTCCAGIASAVRSGPNGCVQLPAHPRLTIRCTYIHTYIHKHIRTHRLVAKGGWGCTRQMAAGTSITAILASYLECVHTTLEKGA
jgi:hypothetical protein